MKKMNTYELIAVVGVIVCVCGSLGFVFPYLKKKGINTGTILQEAETGLQEAETIIQTGEQLLGNKVSKAAGILSLIDTLSLKATKAAQQLFVSSQLPLEQRKSKAIEVIKEGLTLFKIPINTQMEKIIDNSVEATVLDSKTPDEQRNQCQNALSQQISQLQIQLSQIGAQNAQLVTENAQLKQQIATVQNTVQASQNTTPAVQTVQ